MNQALLVASFLLGIAAAQQTASPAQRFAELKSNLVKEVQAQLRSDDLRTIAWGAYAAAGFRLERCIPELRAKLATLAKGEGEDRAATVCAIFDALIETKAIVPGEELEPFLEGFAMDPALFLLGRRTQANQKFLLQAYRKLDGSSNATWLACGNYLARSANPEFALELLRAQVILQIRVADPGAGGEELCSMLGSSIGCSLGNDPEGYPSSKRYAFTTDEGSGGVLAAYGPTPVFLRTTTDGGRCVLQDFDNPEFLEARTKWLETMLDTHANSLHFDLAPLCSVEFTDATAFVTAVKEQRVKVEGEFRSLIDACLKAKLLSSPAAEGLTPVIVIQLHDWRQDRSVPLPEVK
jgi:hypothetical protein